MRRSLKRSIDSPLRFFAAFLLLSAALAGAAGAAVAGEPPGESPRPNIIFILADDLGWADLGCYGQTFFETPNLDRLAAGGVRFTSGYAASCVCSPTRSSVMTGKYPARNDLTIWLGGRGGAPAADHLCLDEVTIAEALGEGGYATAHIGKWHLGGEPYFPERQGFDVNIGGNRTGTPAGGYFAPYRNPQLPDGPDGEYLTDRLTDECLGLIDRWRDRPFFIHLAYYTPHTPIQGRKDLVQYYREKRRPGETYNVEYAAMVHGLDENVGRIMARLEELRLDRQTIVVFFSDNGGFSHSRGKKNNVTCNKPLRLGKGYCYEGGHRVPAIVRYPPVTGRGGVCDAPIITTDFYPTFLELAGLPQRPEQHADGVSIVPLLADPKGGRIDRDTLYWHYPHHSPQGGTPSGAIRQGDWKLLEFFCDGRLELYNLADDLGESNDLAEKLPERVEQLHAKLKAWREEVDAKLPPPPEPPPRPIETTDAFPGFDALIDVRLTLAGKTLTKKLTRPMPHITHYGYGVVRTRSAFSPVAVER